MPVQLIIAGKAHPQDIQGKELIRQIIHFAMETKVRNHVIFKDYDINVARYMVQGVDQHLNTPLRPMKLSSTSGMKVPRLTCALNISIPDGWW